MPGASRVKVDKTKAGLCLFSPSRDARGSDQEGLPHHHPLRPKGDHFLVASFSASDAFATARHHQGWEFEVARSVCASRTDRPAELESGQDLSF